MSACMYTAILSSYDVAEKEVINWKHCEKPFCGKRWDKMIFKLTAIAFHFLRFINDIAPQICGAMSLIKIILQTFSFFWGNRDDASSSVISLK